MRKRNDNLYFIKLQRLYCFETAQHLYATPIYTYIKHFLTYIKNIVVWVNSSQMETNFQLETRKLRKNDWQSFHSKRKSTYSLSQALFWRESFCGPHVVCLNSSFAAKNGSKAKQAIYFKNTNNTVDILHVYIQNN